MAIDIKENPRLAFTGASRKSNLVSKMLSEEAVSDKELVNLPLDMIDSLEAFEHPFEKSLKLGIELLAESIKENGLMQPITVRKKDNGRYEILAGHRRVMASKLAGLDEIDAIIKYCDDDEAVLVVNHTNIHQREEIYPSERAKAYKLELEALKNQGKRNDLVKEIEDESNLCHSVAQVEELEDSNLCHTVAQVKSRDLVAQLFHTSKSNVSMYIRLNNLVTPLLDMVDDKEIPIRAGVELSYLKESEQYALEQVLANDEKIKITIELAKELREQSKDMLLTDVIIDSIINPPKEEDVMRKKKPTYVKAFKRVEKYIKTIDEARAAKLEFVDAKELEERIKQAVDEYLDSL